MESSGTSGPVQVQVQPVQNGPSLWAVVLLLALILATLLSVLFAVNSLSSDIHQLEREIRLLEAWAEKLNSTIILEGGNPPPGPLEGEQDAR